MFCSALFVVIFSLLLLLFLLLISVFCSFKIHIFVVKTGLLSFLRLRVFKDLYKCARTELYSLESMLIEKEKLNTQASGNGKIALLTIS